MFRRSGSRNWYAKLGGRWISLRTADRREAQAREARLRYSALPEVVRLVASPPDTLTRDLFAEFARSARVADSTLESYRAVFAGFRDWDDGRTRLAAALSPAVCSRYLEQIGNARTANLARSVLSRIWRVSGQPDPWAQTATRREENHPFRPLTDEEVVRLLKVCGPDWRGPVLVSFYTGLRLKDALLLRREDVRGDHIELRPAKTRRTGRAVYIPVHPALRAELARLRPSSGFLFPGLASRYGSVRTSLVREFARLLVKAKVAAGEGQRVGFHSLRATFATRAKSAGVPLDDLRAMMGHTKAGQTQHYVDSPESLSLAVYPPLEAAGNC